MVAYVLSEWPTDNMEKQNKTTTKLLLSKFGTHATPDTGNLEPQKSRRQKTDVAQHN